MIIQFIQIHALRNLMHQGTSFTKYPFLILKKRNFTRWQGEEETFCPNKEPLLSPPQVWNGFALYLLLSISGLFINLVMVSFPSLANAMLFGASKVYGPSETNWELELSLTTITRYKQLTIYFFLFFFLIWEKKI